MNERALETLFDFHRFEPNDVLTRLIREAEERYPQKENSSERRNGFRVVTNDKAGFEVLSGGKREISDTDMSFVNAAGVQDVKKDRQGIDGQEDNV